MSWEPAIEPAEAGPEHCDALETVLIPRARDIGAFEVRRALPSAKRKLVGPFIFFDQFGPTTFEEGKGLDVRPHPHIGLATVTYLFQGGIVHKDSLGSDMEITPGALNWMVAGRGIVHSERTARDRRKAGEPIYGIQTWVALPEKDEDCAPSFEHVTKDALPVIEGEGKTVKLILGRLYGARAPVRTFSDMFYADARVAAGRRLALPADHEDRGVYVLEGEIEVGGDTFGPGQLLVFRPGDEIALKAVTPARLMLLGGDTMEGPRFVWWNLVSSSKEKIREAREDWASGQWGKGRFTLPPGDDGEHIPAPEI